MTPLPRNAVHFYRLELSDRALVGMPGAASTRPSPLPLLHAQPRRVARPPSPPRRRALELLASCRDGCTEALMFANGFTAELLVELVPAGFASAHAERMVADAG